MRTTAFGPPGAETAYKQREGGVSLEEQEGEMREIHSNYANDCTVYFI